ncbi:MULTISPECIES: DUF4760 domain-containing protein [Nocardia]|uniref:DUF4760 domain-containing protein n=1 Tax=Nocardia nova TaxID=37330 RepID=A0A2T2YT95_9NOCA|nr:MULTISPECIES: DUF4760 domain-containing protein [Nocardia]PSR58706.1 DUF4760 domain-containing protein [Nocardia nova]
MSAFLAVVPALTLLVAVAGLGRLVHETRRENRRQQQRATVTYITSTLQRQHELYAEIHQDPDFARKAAVIDSAEFHQLTSYFAHLEYLAAGVNMRIFDEEVVNRTVGGRILRACSIFRAWMDSERVRLENPAVYEELEQLAVRLRERRRQAIPSGLAAQPAELETS